MKTTINAISVSEWNDIQPESREKNENLHIRVVRRAHISQVDNLSKFRKKAFRRIIVNRYISCMNRSSFVVDKWPTADPFFFSSLIIIIIFFAELSTETERR